MKISVIIPFFNAMPFMQELLDALYKNINEIDTCNDYIEILFVNDGSTDNYLEILEPFSEWYTNVKIISVPNGGVGCARNIGLKHANGEYVWFVDADDIVEDHAFLNLVKYIHELEELPDIIYCNCKGYEDQHAYYHQFKYIYSDHLEGVKHIQSDADRSDMFNILFGRMKVNYAIWYQLFRRSFLIQNNVFFDIELKVSEDLDFKFKTLALARSISGFDVCTYVYRLPNDNRTSLSRKRMCVDQMILLCEMYSRWYEYFQAKSTLEESIGYSLMKNKFSLLVYSSYALLKNNIDDSQITAYLAKKKVYLEGIYHNNKSFLDNVVKEIRAGNYTNV